MPHSLFSHLPLTSATLALTLVLGLPLPGQAFSYVPPNRGAPGRSSTLKDAVSRSCGLIMVEPTQTHWGETAQPRPTFWIYASNPGEVSFTLRDETNSREVYATTYATAGPGLAPFTLPADAPELAIDDLYRWSFTLDCPITDSEMPITGIVVRREISEPHLQAILETEASLSDASLAETFLAETSQAEHINQLAEAGLWYDAVDRLLKGRQQTPDSEVLATLWQQLVDHPSVQLYSLLDIQPLSCSSSEEL